MGCPKYKNCKLAQSECMPDSHLTPIHCNGFVKKEPASQSSEGPRRAGCYGSLLSDYRKLREAAKCIRHWHDSHNGGMIVSGSHVRELWKALAETQEV